MERERGGMDGERKRRNGWREKEVEWMERERGGMDGERKRRNGWRKRWNGWREKEVEWMERERGGMDGEREREGECKKEQGGEGELRHTGNCMQHNKSKAITEKGCNVLARRERSDPLQHQ